jgi:putative ABC transport system permease protein
MPATASRPATLMLAACGIYAVMAYAITQRTRELGLRIALGAQPLDVLKLVMGQGTKLILCGVLSGLGRAFALARLINTLLFHIDAIDPLTFASVAWLLMAVALVACWIPAWRATKVDPLIALRCE